MGGNFAPKYARQEAEMLNQQLQEMARKAAVEVSDTVFSGTTLQIGDQILNIKEDVSRVKFSQVEKDDEVHLEMTPI